MFDLQTFLNTSLDKAGSTEYVLVPEGTYRCEIQPVVRGREVDVDDKTRNVVVVDLPCKLLDEKIQLVTHRAVNVAPFPIWLDLTKDGAIDLAPGTNVPLGRLRATFNQNKDGKPWSFQMLVGVKGNCHVTRVTSKKDGRVYAQVDQLTAL